MIVYLNSALNIAAANGDYGCFSTRTPGQVYGCKVLAVESRHGSSTFKWDITRPHLGVTFISNVLNSRAWVFQEYYLAPRTLHFTEH
jgi:hypothetical protein